jgi:cell division protein FtsL
MVVLSGLMLFFWPVIQQTHYLQAKKTELQNRIADHLNYQEQLQVETEHMKSDPAYVEHIARDQLNMGRPGETIVQFNSYKMLGAPEPRTVTAQPAAESEDNP